MKKNKKLYLIDQFLYHEGKIIEFENILADEEYVSKIIESIIAINLSYLKEDVLNHLEGFLLFWYNSKEIDFIFKNDEMVAIEVKYRNKVDKPYKITQIKDYIVLTKNNLKFEMERVRMAFIPAFLFLLMLKKKESYL